MPEPINNAIALQVNPNPLDLSKTVGTIAQLEMARAHSGLYNAQAQFQQNRVNALAQATKAYQAGDVKGAVNALLVADPDWASKFQDTVQTGKKNSALAAYGGAASRGDPDAVGQIASVSPEDIARIAQARNSMKESDRKQFDLTHDAVGRASSVVLSIPPGPQRDQVYRQELDRLHQTGAIDDPTYQRRIQATPNDLELNSFVRQSMAVQQARESYGEKAAAEAPAKIAEAVASNAGRPLSVSPNNVVTTGAQALSPTAQAGIDNAFQRLGLAANNGVAGPSAANSPNVVPEGSDKIIPKRWPAASGPPPLPRPDASAAPPVDASKLQGRVPALPPTAPQPGTFTPRLIRNPDGSVASTANPGSEKMQTDAAARYAKAGENYKASTDLSMRLDMMDNAIENLNTSGWSSTGTGANAKIGAAKAINSALATFNLPAAVDPNKIASWEDFNKELTRAGFELAKTLGSREAQMIVQQAVSAVPNAENTYLGAKLVSSSIRQAAQREIDYYKFSTDYARKNSGDTFGADIAFNDANPPQLYAKTAIANALPKGAIADLRRDPKLAPFFDQKYGPGISDFVLHGAGK